MKFPKKIRHVLELHGIAFDDDGLPLPAPGSIAHTECSRCNCPNEHPTDAIFFKCGKVHQVQLCGDCFKLMLTNPDEFYKGMINGTNTN